LAEAGWRWREVMWASKSRDIHSSTCCILGMRSGDLDSSRDAGIASFRLPATAQMHVATEAAERGLWRQQATSC